MEIRDKYIGKEKSEKILESLSKRGLFWAAISWIPGSHLAGAILLGHGSSLRSYLDEVDNSQLENLENIISTESFANIQYTSGNYSEIGDFILQRLLPKRLSGLVPQFQIAGFNNQNIEYIDALVKIGDRVFAVDASYDLDVLNNQNKIFKRLLDAAPIESINDEIIRLAKGNLPIAKSKFKSKAFYIELAKYPVEFHNQNKYLTPLGIKEAEEDLCLLDTRDVEKAGLFSKNSIMIVVRGAVSEKDASDEFEKETVDLDQSRSLEKVKSMQELNLPTEIKNDESLSLSREIFLLSKLRENGFSKTLESAYKDERDFLLNHKDLKKEELKKIIGDLIKKKASVVKQRFHMVR